MPDAARHPRPLVATLRPEGVDAAAVDRAADVLAQAFLTDPYTLGLLPADRRAERLTGKFAARIRSALHAAGSGAETPGAVDLALDPHDGAVLAVAVWERPGPRHAVTLPGRVASVPGLWRVHGRHTVDQMRIDASCERHRPEAPHWYLVDVGTAPDAQGRGAASTLVRRRQREAAAAGVGMHLEAATPALVPFYARLGFAETGVVPTPGASRLTAMWWEA